MSELALLSTGMRIVTVVVAFLGSTAPSPFARDKESQRFSSFFSVYPRYEYKQPVHEISEVDFRNLVVPFFKKNGKCCDYSAKLANGHSFVREALQSNDVVLLSVDYFEFSLPEQPVKQHAGAAQFAIVTYGWESTGASASGYGAVNLYKILNERRVLIQQVNFVGQTPGTGAYFDPSTRNLTVIASRYDARDAHCCPSKQDIITFRWTGRFFREASIRTTRYVSNSNHW